jgi:hypothetical protein
MSYMPPDLFGIMCMHERQQDIMKQVMAESLSVGGFFHKPSPKDGAWQNAMEQLEIWPGFDLSPSNCPLHNSFHPLFSWE